MRKILLILTIGLVLLLTVSAVSASLPNTYYRWSSAPGVTCLTESGNVKLVFASQPVEWNNLPVDAMFGITYIDNNDPPHVTGPFPAPDGTGSHVFGALAELYPSYPLKYTVVLETFVNGVTIYQSTLTGNCTADGAGTSSLFNFSPSEGAYYRWSATPGATCSVDGVNINVLMVNQPIEWNLPVDAQARLQYFGNGVEYHQPAIPFDAPDGIGSQIFGSFLASFPIAYPISFEFRVTTLIGGVVVYQSSYFANCGASGAAAVSVVNQVVNWVSSAGGCVTPLPVNAVQGRLLEATATYSAASLDAPTNITLPAGSSWYVLSGQDGFYRLRIACNASALWVPASAVTPNYSPPWNGAALPASGG